MKLSIEMPNGIRVSLDGERPTPETESMLRMLLRLEGGAVAPAPAPAADPKSKATPHKTAPPNHEEKASTSASRKDQFDLLLKKLNPNQHRAMRAIKLNPGSTSAELGIILKTKTANAISGYTTPARRHIAAVGLKSDDVFSLKVTGAGRDVVSRYYPGPLLEANEVPELPEAEAEGEDEDEAGNA